MQSYQREQGTNAWPDQVLVEARGQIDAIANYIDHVLEELTSFTHIFNDGIDSIMLQQSPGSTFTKNLHCERPMGRTSLSR